MLLLVPEAGHHQLEVRGLDVDVSGFVPIPDPRDHSAAGRDEFHRAGLDLREHLVDQLRPDRDLLALMVAVVFRDRSSERLDRRLPVEGGEAQVVVEQAPDFPFEAVKLRQGVFAEGEQEIDVEVGPVDRDGEFRANVPGPSSRGW